MKPKIIEISKKNAAFQVFLSLRENRSKRHREGKFLVEGVKPLNQLLRNAWEVEALLLQKGAGSAWSKNYVRQAKAPVVYELSLELMAELSGKDTHPELLALVNIPDLGPGQWPCISKGVYVVVDRPNSPGNLGSLIRSAEAFGAAAMLTYGHAADFFDPKTISASIGTLFALPLGHLESAAEFQHWRDAYAGKEALQVAALDEKGDMDLWQFKQGEATVMVVGNETDGLSKVFKEACTAKLRIPMQGSATSLNAANSGSILLYELLARGTSRPN
jgi:TrmH family RNA methyltransferase